MAIFGCSYRGRRTPTHPITVNTQLPIRSYHNIAIQQPQFSIRRMSRFQRFSIRISRVYRTKRNISTECPMAQGTKIRV